VARVARGYGQPFWNVLDAEWGDVLQADMALDELERVERFAREADALRFAQYVAIAMSPGQGLAPIGQALERAAQRQRQDVEPDEAARIMRQVDKVLRIERRKRRQTLH
jgi:hypothetical protein